MVASRACGARRSLLHLARVGLCRCSWAGGIVAWTRVRRKRNGLAERRGARCFVYDPPQGSGGTSRTRAASLQPSNPGRTSLAQGGSERAADRTAPRGDGGPVRRYLQRWAATVERHTQAVAQLEAYAGEWKDASSRVRHEATERLQDLEATIEREWDTLKRMQEEPIRQLREQAESLQQASLAMANASLKGVERAEARFASVRKRSAPPAGRADARTAGRAGGNRRCGWTAPPPAAIRPHRGRWTTSHGCTGSCAMVSDRG